MAKSRVDKTMVPAPERKPKPGTSPYLKFQDKNGDGLPDVCDDAVPPGKVCLDCVPNPYAINSNWRARDQTHPILNEKNCKYQITFVTPETTTGYTEGMTDDEAAEALKEMFEKYGRDAIQIMLEEFQKDDSFATVEKVLRVTEFADFHIAPNLGSRLKLLYSVDFSEVFGLPELQLDDSEPEESERDDIKVKFTAGDMRVLNIKVRKGLNLYNRYLKVFTGTQGGHLKFKKDDRYFDLSGYGDDTIFGTSSMASIFNDLDSWLSSRGFTMSAGLLDPVGSDRLITDLVMVFDGEYTIKKMQVFTQGCGDRPAATYKKKRLSSLRRRSSFKDKTAVAYFARMKDMEREFSARRPKPWIEFLEEYTYPEIYAWQPEGEIGKPSTMSCIRDNLENEFKDLGQDIFDEVFTIGDAVAKAFHDSLCRTNPDQVKKDLGALGVNQGGPCTDPYNVESMQNMQAYFTVDEKDPIFVNMCKRSIMYGGFGGMSMGALDELYKRGLGPLKYCGLYDLLFESMECLFKGLTLSEALGRIILTALKAMGVEDFGKLFVGLPPEKQVELDALVKKNLKSGKAVAGEAFADKSVRAEDAPFFGEINFVKPWKDEAFVRHQEQTSRPDAYGAQVPSKNKAISNYDPTVERRTLGQQLGGPSPQAKSKLDSQKVFDAYILALAEVYKDNYLELLDQLSNFPGAQLISAAIALLDCPQPPLFNPGVMDFVKSLGMPFCRNQVDITSIRMENPFKLIPKLSDILGLLFELLKKAFWMLLAKILMAILSKVCEIIGNAICKALETVGSIAGSLPGIISGRENLVGIIRDTICGPTVSNEQVENTVVEIVNQLGVGGAALADRERAISFFADTMNVMTRQEAFEAMIDGPSAAALDIIDSIVEHDYPEYRAAMPNKESISKFYRNVGFLMPAESRDELREVLNAFPEELDLPANPSMCSTPEELDLFNEQRCSLLEGRMSPAQCETLNMSAKAQLLEDLEDIGKVVHEGIPNIVEANMPPFFSDPECSNGLMPIEPEPSKIVATTALKGEMDKVKLAYTEDMLGEGTFFYQQKNWGLLNMVLSDTHGDPWTVHQDKVQSGDRWVDYYGETEPDSVLPPPVPPANPFLLPIWLVSLVVWCVGWPIIAIGNALIKLFASEKRGAYPQYVAGWLRGQFLQTPQPYKSQLDDSKTNETIINDLRGTDGVINFTSTNDKRKKKSWSKSFSDLGFVGFLWDTDVELVDMPNHGYNAQAKVDFENDRVVITRKERKDTADVTLTFRDNAKGYRSPRNISLWGYGFKLRGYYSDLIKEDGVFKNRPDDNMRVSVMTMINTSADTARSLSKVFPDDDKPTPNTEDRIIKDRRYEFLSIDDSLDNIDIEDYPELAKTFEGYKSYSPPIAALSDLTNGALSIEDSQKIYEEVNQTFYNLFASEIGSNEQGWLFGTTADNLDRSDFELGVVLDADLASDNVGSVGDFIPISKLQVRDDDGDLNLVSSEDGILGISRNQYENDSRGTSEDTRVFYLDPGKYGGSYMNPPVYAKPLPNSGWTGMIDLLFPERSPCAPKTTGLANFSQINQMIDSYYPRIPEDKRLMASEDCVLEVPFNRILTRPSKAAIRGLVMAGIKTFASTGFVKSIATFTKFAPNFEQNYSKIYAGYIVETMKEAMMSTGGNFLNPFNDTEFWYAYLEQAVQMYSDRLDDDQDETFTPSNCPPSVQSALEKINSMQSKYKYPYDFNDFNSEDYGTFESMKSFRESKNLEAVKKVETEAKIVMQELVIEQLKLLAVEFNKNLSRAGFTAAISNMNYYFFNNHCNGGEALQLHGELLERPVAGTLPDEGSNLYTTGDMLALPSGLPYVGEYHVHRDIDGTNIYMAGAEHGIEEHDRLVPYANLMEVYSKQKIDGKVTEKALGDISTASGDKRFYLKKYVSVGGAKMSSAEAESAIRGHGTGNISDYYRGTIELVQPPIRGNGRDYIGTQPAIGITGNLGVQYVLEFGIDTGGVVGARIPITEVRIDALDLPVAEFKGITPSSKLLLCLINQLQDDAKYRLAVDYIFSMKKSLSMLAIYNDLGLLPSVGELTVAAGDMTSSDEKDKPGGRLIEPTVIDVARADGSTYQKIALKSAWTAGWASEDDRNGFLSSFGYLDWDEWDKQVLRNTTRTIKDIFKPYYRDRKFSIQEYSGPSAAEQFTAGITERFRFNSAMKVLPWYQKSQVRGNPFNADGAECSKKDSD